VSFGAIILCVASQRVFFVVVVYFVIDSVRKLLDTPSYYVTIKIHLLRIWMNMENDIDNKKIVIIVSDV
jgi:hypothetical protein